MGEVVGVWLTDGPVGVGDGEVPAVRDGAGTDVGVWAGTSVVVFGVGVTADVVAGRTRTQRASTPRNKPISTRVEVRDPSPALISAAGATRPASGTPRCCTMSTAVTT